MSVGWLLLVVLVARVGDFSIVACLALAVTQAAAFASGEGIRAEAVWARFWPRSLPSRSGALVQQVDAKGQAIKEPQNVRAPEN